MQYERKQARKADRQRKEAVRKKRKTLEKAAPALLKACEDFIKGWPHFCDCIDFGKSALDAEAIQFMNEVPGKIEQAAIATTKT